MARVDAISVQRIQEVFLGGEECVPSAHDLVLRRTSTHTRSLLATFAMHHVCDVMIEERFVGEVRLATCAFG